MTDGPIIRLDSVRNICPLFIVTQPFLLAAISVRGESAVHKTLLFLISTLVYFGTDSTIVWYYASIINDENWHINKCTATLLAPYMFVSFFFLSLLTQKLINIIAFKSQEEISIILY